MLSMDAYPDDLNFMDCNGVEADDLGDLFSANFSPQNSAAFIFDEHSPSSVVMGNDDLAQLPAPSSTSTVVHSNEFLVNNHHHHHNQQEDSHLNGIGFIKNDVTKISQSQQQTYWTTMTKNENDWQQGGLEANDYLLSNIPVDTPVTATDCAFAEETSVQINNKTTVPDNQYGWEEQLHQHATSTSANSNSHLFTNYSPADDKSKGDIPAQHLNVPDASLFVEVLDSNTSNDSFIPNSMATYHALSNTYDYEKHDVYRSYLLDHDYTSLRPYHEMPSQLAARRLHLPAALPRIRVKRRQPDNAYRISSASGTFFADSSPLMVSTSVNNASTSGSENKNQMDYYVRIQEPQPVRPQPLTSSTQAQSFRRCLQPAALRTSRNQMGNNYPTTTNCSRSSTQSYQQQQPVATPQPQQNHQSQNDQNPLPDRPPVLLPQSTIRQPPMMRYTATGYANGVGSGGAIKFYDDPLELQRTNRKYRRQHQSIKALAGKHSMYCSTCRMRYFYPAAQIYKHIRWMTAASGDGKATPYFLCKVCGCNTQL